MNTQKYFISKHIIDDIAQKIDIVSLIGRYVSLQHRNGKYWGLSPFKTEKTPSFTVDPVKKLYYCFSTQQGGNVFTFIQKIEQVSFVNAAHILAKETGIVIPKIKYEKDERDDNSLYTRAMSILSYISEWSIEMLEHHRQSSYVKDYLQNRNITTESSIRFCLGYIPPERNGVYQLLKEKGYSDAEMAFSGLFSKNSTQYCLFTHRLVFPIIKSHGTIVGFGGRALTDDGPKYINSPQSILFEKKQMLYGLYEATQEKYSFKKFFIVEGYFDVIAMHQSGIKNAVAPLGTAFTVEHARMLRRFTNTIIFVFDNDEAGMKATIRSAALCEKEGFESIRIVVTPQNDIADILKEYGEIAVRDELAEDKDFFDYYVGKIVSTKMNNQQERELSLIELCAYVAMIPIGYRREMYITTVTQLFGVTRTVVQEVIKQQVRNKRIRDSIDTHNDDRKDITTIIGNDLLSSKKVVKKISKTPEMIFIAALSYNLQNYDTVRHALSIEDLVDENARHVYLKIEEMFREGELVFTELMERIDPDIAIAIEKLVFSEEVSRFSNVLVMEFLSKRQALKLQRENNEINRQLAMKEQILTNSNNTSAEINYLSVRKEIIELLEHKKSNNEKLLKMKNKNDDKAATNLL